MTLTVDEVTEIYRDEADLIRHELRAFPAAGRHHRILDSTLCGKARWRPDRVAC